MKTLSKPKNMDDAFKTMHNSIKERKRASTYYRDLNMNQKLRVLGNSMATQKNRQNGHFGGLKTIIFKIRERPRC